MSAVSGGVVAVVGEALVDFVQLGPEPLFEAFVGGSPANVAVGLARLGVPARLAARISTDPLGRRIHRHLDENGVDLSYARRKNLTVYDVVTIASMVERETRVARERPLVAAVIYNRLHAHQPLGIDATIRYATANWTRPLTKSELALDSPYNTRTRVGLPPTPIGNPGLASLEAAAHPARVGYLYYVVKPGTCGEHAFSSTFAEFQRDQARYNTARQAAGGRSPTTC